MFHDFRNLLYPRFCQCCQEVLLKNESVICVRCLYELPVTNFHEDNENATVKVFYGRINIEQAASLLLFEKKGKVQQLIHNLKYKGQEEVGDFLGKWMGTELKKLPAFREVTVVVPVPLHKSKLRKRGFNQVEKFGKQIALALQVPYVDSVLLKKTSTLTQTFKSRLLRWGELEESFSIENPQILAMAHVLIVDDLVTTGATIEACAGKLLSIPGVKISVASMAIAVG